MRLELVEYDFRVQYLKGKDNYVKDSLSRTTLKDVLCLFKHGREITARYDVSDLYTNGILD